MTNIRRALQSAAGSGGVATSAMTFGSNSDGQLGLGNTTNYSSPVLVGEKDTWSKVGGGRRVLWWRGYHSRQSRRYFMDVGTEQQGTTG